MYTVSSDAHSVQEGNQGDKSYIVDLKTYGVLMKFAF